MLPGEPVDAPGWQIDEPHETVGRADGEQVLVGVQRDGTAACWDAKYHYNFWRPTHAIQRADTDGNPATSPDLTWAPLVIGNHPEYPSGHACFTAGVTEALHNYFKTRHVRLVVSSTAPGAGPPRTYETLDELVTDVENARVWGGLHFRTTMTRTARDFPRIARAIGRQYFLIPRRSLTRG